MTTTHRVALLGFSAPERKALATHFRLAATREPRYELVQNVSDADWFVADAADEPAQALVLATERLPETVFVGEGAPAGAVAGTPRPVDPLRVLRELDALVAARTRSASSQARAGDAQAGRVRTQIRPTPRKPAADKPAPPVLPADDGGAPPVPMPLELHLPPAMLSPPPLLHGDDLPTLDPSTAWPPLGPESQAPAPAPAPPARAPAPQRAAASPPPLAALLVDDSTVALHFLRKRLERFRFRTDLAHDSHEAVALLERRDYDIVFLDMELGEASPLDGLALCQRIKRFQSSRLALAPVVIVSAHHGELDRVRGTLAGCDAFLPKPLDDEQLEAVLLRLRLPLPGHEVRVRQR